LRRDVVPFLAEWERLRKNSDEAILLLPSLKAEVVVHFAKRKNTVERPGSTISNVSQELTKVTRNRDVVDRLKRRNFRFGQRWVQSKSVNVGSKDTHLHTLQEC
jgi:hypothetical protein